MDKEALLPGALAARSAVLWRGPAGGQEEDVTVGRALRGVVPLGRALDVHWHEVRQSLGQIAATERISRPISTEEGWGDGGVPGPVQKHKKRKN